MALLASASVMEPVSSSEESADSGVLTRGAKRAAEGKPLASPLLESYFPRKVPRVLPPQRSTVGPETLRSIRQRGARGGAPPLTGHLASLPQELLEHVLGYCSARELGSLEAASSYFIKTGITDRVARHFLKDIPRAKGLKPRVDKGESYITLFSFIQGQSNAAAQGTAVAVGTYYTAALLHQRNCPAAPEYGLYTMGRGFHGQLGLGDYDDQSVPKMVGAVEKDTVIPLHQGLPDDVQLAVISAGSCHTAAISRRGELYTWGLASSGELGQGGWTPIEVCVPRQITSLLRTRIVSVAAGGNHTLAISEVGQLYSCGRGRHGQLGLGHFHDEGVLTMVDAVREEKVVSVAAGRAHSMALAADGRIFTWGDGRSGQLGHQQLVALVNGANPQPVAIPTPQAIQSLEPSKLKPSARVTAVAGGGDHSMAVTVGGSLLAFGSNKWGQLGTGDRIDRMVPTQVPLVRDDEPGVLLRGVQVQCGAQHTLVLVQNRGWMEVRAAGCNAYGQLGLGDRTDRLRFHPVPALKKANVSCISVGDFHNAAVCADGAIWTWGRGDCGQLGQGDDKARWKPKLLAGFSVVHPDRTLRRNRKVVLKALLLPAESASGSVSAPSSNAVQRRSRHISGACN